MLRRRWFRWLVALAILLLGGYLMLQPRWIIRRLNGHTPGVTYAVETDAQVIALTIDDGPDPDSTPHILDVLAEYDARATFFLLAERIPGSEDIVRKIVAEGHELGNHLLTDRASIHLTASEFERQLLEAQRLLDTFAKTRWFRPGSGWHNQEMLATIADHGYKTVLGSIYPYDAHVPSSWLAAHYVLWRAHPGGVIILHDSGARGDRTVETLKVILPVLQERGYRIVTLTELSQLADPADGA